MKTRGFSVVDIHQTIADWAAEDRPFALAVVLQATGSTPRKAGTKALIDSSGAIHGTIGGGQVEAEAQRQAISAIQSRCPLIFDFALEGNDAQDGRPICGGTMRVLIDPTIGDHIQAYAAAAEARRLRRRGVLLTTVQSDPTVRVRVRWFEGDTPPGDIEFPPVDVIRAAIAAQQAQLSQDRSPARLEGLVEPIVPAPLLLIAGGGHVGQALALHASLVGFDIVVIDDRPEFVDPSLYPPGTITRCGDIAGEIEHFSIDQDTYIAIVTRGHLHDKRALAACLRRPAAYLGMIGSRRKVAMIRQDLREGGSATQEQLVRLHAPIGLDIGAQTVSEIAVSIVAQLIAVRRKAKV